MLTPYPLEPPPRLPPLDEPWVGEEAPLRSGRRARVGNDGAVTLACRVTILPKEGSLRSFVPLEEPSFIWEVRGSATASLDLGGADVRIERAEDGSALWLTRESVPHELLVACRGGTVEVVERNGALTLMAAGVGILRLIAVAATDETDRERTLRALARKGFGGLCAQRRQHGHQVEALGAVLLTPDRAKSAAFDDRKVALDAALEELPGGRRVLPDPLHDGIALLAFGLREPVRDVLRGPFDAPELFALLGAYARWAGDDEFVQRHWPRVLAEFRDGGWGKRAPAIATALLPVAEALGDPEGIALMIATGANGAGAPPEPRSLAPDEFTELWGIIPDGSAGAIYLAPALPRGWSEMTLARLRIARSTLDVRVRRRPGQLTINCRITHGPPLLVRLEPSLGFPLAGVLLNDVTIGGPAAQFELADEAAVVWAE